MPSVINYINTWIVRLDRIDQQYSKNSIIKKIWHASLPDFFRLKRLFSDLQVKTIKKDTFKFKLHVFLVVNLNSLRGRNTIRKKISMEIFLKITPNAHFYIIGNHIWIWMDFM